MTEIPDDPREQRPARSEEARNPSDPSARIGLPLRIGPLGDAAVFAEFSETLDLEVNARIQRLAVVIRNRRLPWVRDVVPAFAGLALYFDTECGSEPSARIERASALIRTCLEQIPVDTETPPRTVEIPVCYESEFAPDLEAVAGTCLLTREEVIRRHSGSPNRVLMVGFAPGHPYIGGLDQRLAVPRRSTPRPVVPAGSVAIANAQTVIYPFTMPGGWNIIGRTPLALFDALREPPALLAPGDAVRFLPIGSEAYRHLESQVRQ